jgi:hypothetical protein
MEDRPMTILEGAALKEHHDDLHRLVVQLERERDEERAARNAIARENAKRIEQAIEVDRLTKENYRLTGEVASLEGVVDVMQGELYKAREEGHYVPSREAEELIARCAKLDDQLSTQADTIHEQDDLIAEMREALDELVKLQAHYARLLNQYDGGKRRAFVDANAWLARLRELKAKTDGD